MPIDSIDVTKESISKTTQGYYRIMVSVVCKEGANETINQSFSVEYYDKPGKEIITEKVRSVVNDLILKYEEDKVFADKEKINLAIVALQTNLRKDNQVQEV